MSKITTDYLAPLCIYCIWFPSVKNVVTRDMFFQISNSPQQKKFSKQPTKIPSYGHWWNLERFNLPGVVMETIALTRPPSFSHFSLGRLKIIFCNFYQKNKISNLTSSMARIQRSSIMTWTEGWMNEWMWNTMPPFGIP